MNKQAVIYARYSSDKQTEQSIEGQLRVCYEFAKAQGYDIQKEYIDRAMTGTNDNRPSFLQMIDDSKFGDFQYVLVYKIDRFSRNTYDSTIYKHKLQQNGVKVVSATEAISDTMEGKLIERILESMAEMYSKDLSQKVKRGMRETRIKKNFLGGFAPLGYKVENKKLVIDEEQAEYVKYIFEHYAKGSPQKDIITYLSNKKVKTNKNNVISHNSLHRVLKNKKYIGILEYGGDIIEDYCPAIIDKDLFYKVQDKLLENQKSVRTKKEITERFILSGHIFCGYCGHSVIGDSGTARNGTKHFYYSCRKKKNLHQHCELNSVNKSLLEDRIISQTLRNLVKDIDSIVNSVYKYLNSLIEDYKIKEYENKIKKVDKDIDKVFNQFKVATSQTLIEKLNKEADELAELKEEYRKELNKLIKLNAIQLTKNEIRHYIQNFMELGKSDLIEEKITFVNTFINIVYIYNNKTYIYLNIDDGNKTINYEEHNEDKGKIYLIKIGSSNDASGLPIYGRNICFGFF